jgi:hypothetical protein
MWIVLVLALGAAPTMKELTFLTRDGCVNTPDMVNNLDDALTATVRRAELTRLPGRSSVHRRDSETVEGRVR